MVNRKKHVCPEKFSDIVATLPYSDIGVALGISKSMISRLISGHRKPGLQLALRIQKHFNIPATDWLVEAGE